MLNGFSHPCQLEESFFKFKGCCCLSCNLHFFPKIVHVEVQASWPPSDLEMSMKFILLMYVKMPTIVGILTSICRINTTSEMLKSRNVFICRDSSFYEQLKVHAQLSLA